MFTRWYLERSTTYVQRYLGMGGGGYGNIEKLIFVAVFPSIKLSFFLLVGSM